MHTRMPLAGFVGVACVILAGCTAGLPGEPFGNGATGESVTVEDFISGQWNCEVIGGTGANQDLTFEIVADDRVLSVSDSGGSPITYTYEVTPTGIVTSAPSGSGWNIETPIEVSPGEDFRVFVNSLSGEWARVENPTISFDDSDSVVVDSFWGYIFRCDVQRG